MRASQGLEWVHLRLMLNGKTCKQSLQIMLACSHWVLVVFMTVILPLWHFIKVVSNCILFIYFRHFLELFAIILIGQWCVTRSDRVKIEQNFRVCTFEEQSEGLTMINCRSGFLMVSIWRTVSFFRKALLFFLSDPLQGTKNRFLYYSFTTHFSEVVTRAPNST